MATELDRFAEWCESQEIFPAEYRADGKRLDYSSWSSLIETWRAVYGSGCTHDFRRLYNGDVRCWTCGELKEEEDGQAEQAGTALDG